MNLIETIKKLWSNPYIKTVIVTAAGGAVGAIEPMVAAGTIVLNSATIHTALVGAGAALWALYLHHPVVQTVNTENTTSAVNSMDTTQGTPKG